VVHPGEEPDHNRQRLLLVLGNRQGARDAAAHEILQRHAPDVRLPGCGGQQFRIKANLQDF
jgi:hypothetical protein